MLQAPLQTLDSQDTSASCGQTSGCLTSLSLCVAMRGAASCAQAAGHGQDPPLPAHGPQQVAMAMD